MSFKSFSIFSSDRHFVSEWNQFSNFGKGALEEHFCEILEILVEGHSRNIQVKLFQNPFTGLGEDVS